MQKEVTKLQAYRREIKTESESRISTCQICGKEIMFGRIFCEEHDIPINKQIYEFFSEFPKNKDGLLIRPRGEKLYQVIKYYLAARLELSKDKRVIMKSCTGAGKSVMLDMLAFIEMTHFPNSLTIIGSISEAVSKMHIERLREWIGGSIFNRYMVGTQEATASKTEIKLAKLNSKVMAMPQCFTENGEILTDSGWKYFSELNGKDKVGEIRENNELSFTKPIKIIKEYYNGNVIHFKNKSLDLTVTPNHRFYVTSKPKGNFKLKEAQNINSSHWLTSDIKWKGKDSKYFILKELDEKWFDHHYHIDEKQIPIDDWALFLGMYIAEGHCEKNSHKVTISQSQKSPYLKEMKTICHNLPFHVGESDLKDGMHRFTIENKQLWKELKIFGKSDSKYIPKYIKTLTPQLIKKFLRGYLIGDGYHDTFTRLFASSSTSKKLIDDVQECFLKVGFKNSRTSVAREGGKMKWTNYTHKKLWKCKHRKRNFTLDKKFASNETYSGMIYCVEVPSQKILVRVNGVPFISGNSPKSRTGWHASLLLVDEIGRMEVQSYYASFSQMAAQGGIEVLASTPYLDSIVMQNIWADDNIINITLEPEECFWIPKEVFRKKEEEYRIGGISALYEQLYGAQFRSLTNRVIPDDLLLQSMAKGEHYPTSKNLIMGIDFGKSIDFTAIVVIDIETGDIKFVDTFQDDWPIQFAKIRKYAKEWNPIKIVADSSHIGDVILSDLRELNIEGVSMHNDILKKSVIDRLIMAFFNNKLNIVSEEFPKLINEVSSYVYYDSDHKKMGPSGRGHDDTVIALSLALRGLDVTSVSDTPLPDNLWSFTRVGGTSSDAWKISNV